MGAIRADEDGRLTRAQEVGLAGRVDVEQDQAHSFWLGSPLEAALNWKPGDLKVPPDAPGLSDGRIYADAQVRKQRPLARGVLDYFPDALMEVAYASYVATEQHHPDKEMHWDKAKSTDDADCLLRHLKDRGTRDSDGVRHSAKAAWRALAVLQREIDAEKN